MRQLCGINVCQEATAWTCFQVGVDVVVSANRALPAHPSCVLSQQVPGSLLSPAPPLYLLTCRKTRRQKSHKKAWWWCRTPIRRWPRRVAGRSSPDRKKHHLKHTVKENSSKAMRGPKAETPQQEAVVDTAPLTCTMQIKHSVFVQDTMS